MEEKRVGRPRTSKNPRQEKINTLGDNMFTANLIAELVTRGKVRINGLGIIKIKRMPPHKAINPHTRKYEIFPSYVKMTFSLSEETKKQMQLWI